MEEYQLARGEGQNIFSMHPPAPLPKVAVVAWPVLQYSKGKVHLHQNLPKLLTSGCMTCGLYIKVYHITVNGIGMFILLFHLDLLFFLTHLLFCNCTLMMLLNKSNQKKDLCLTFITLNACTNLYSFYSCWTEKLIKGSVL